MARQTIWVEGDILTATALNDEFDELYSTLAASGANSDITSLAGLTTPLSVAQGGSGAATLTNHGPLLGSGTDAVTAMAEGATGSFLIPTTGSDPAWVSGQLPFPATANPSADANTLDDYEEGTWTATLTGSTHAPDAPQTETGYYTKIGREVFTTVYLVDKDLTGATGDLRITGIPFTIGNTAMGAALLYGFTFDGSICTYAVATESLLRIWESKTGAAWAPVAVTAASTKYVASSVTYNI